MDSEQLAFEWHNVCEQVKSYSSIDDKQINAFFSRLVPQAMSDGFLMLTADNDFIKTWIERHYVTYIEQALKDLKGIDYMVAIEVDTTQNTASQPAASPAAQPVAPPSPAANAYQPPVRPTVPEPSPAQVQPTQAHSAPNPPSAQPAAAPSLVPAAQHTDEGSFIDSTVDAPTSTLTFSNFVIGESNQLAYSMAVSVAEQPGNPMMNPLFIYGKSGLGKTHLMRAIQNYITVTYPELRTVYVDSAELLNNYMEASLTHDKEKASYKNFKNYYEETDVLLIDDVQYLQGKKQTLDIVFQIFNKLTNQGKQVVLSADRAPKNIDIDERYSSRFNSGVTADIQPPSVETKLGIVVKFVEEYRARTEGAQDFDIPDDVKKYIAENSSSNIRELKSAVTKVIYRMTSFERTDITLDEVRSLLENHFSGGAMKKLTVADIQKAVEGYYKVSHTEIIGKKRSRNIVYARQIAMYLCRQMLDLPYNYIAKSFGGKDHTTIMYSVTNVEKKLEENRELNEELETLKQIINDR